MQRGSSRPTSGGASHGVTWRFMTRYSTCHDVAPHYMQRGSSRPFFGGTYHHIALLSFTVQYGTRYVALHYITSHCSTCKHRSFLLAITCRIKTTPPLLLLLPEQQSGTATRRCGQVPPPHGAAATPSQVHGAHLRGHVTAVKCHRHTSRRRRCTELICEARSSVTATRHAVAGTRS